MTEPGATIEVSEAAVGVRMITLNRPEKRNAISNAMRAALLEALRCADRDDSVRVLGNDLQAGPHMQALLQGGLYSLGAQVEGTAKK